MSISSDQRSFSKLPPETLHQWILFNPDSAFVLRGVSRGFRDAVDDFLQWSEEQLPVQSLPDSILHRLIHCHLSQYSHSTRNCTQIWLAIFRSLDSAGIRSSSKIPSPQELVHWNQRIENVHISVVWSRMTELLAEEGVPGVNTQAEGIRIWMLARPPGLQSITELNLGGLQLAGIPGEIGLCKGLRKLRLACNRLVCLPEKVFHEMSRLQELDLSENRLVSLHSRVFLGLTALQMLKLDYNRLTVLPQRLLNGLSALQILSLGCNQLHSLQQDRFHGLIRLQELFLCGNQLHSLPVGLFEGLTALQRLNLNHNQLTILDAQMLTGLTGLQLLYLNNNQLVSLDWGLIDSLVGLQELYLNDNQLTSLPEGFCLTRLYRLSFDGNQSSLKNPEPDDKKK